MSEEKPQNAETSAPENPQPDIQAFSVKPKHRLPRVPLGKLKPAAGWVRRWKFTLPVLLLVLVGLGVLGWQLAAGSGKNNSAPSAAIPPSKVIPHASSSAPAPGQSTAPSKEEQNIMAHSKFVTGRVVSVSSKQLVLRTSNGQSISLIITSKTDYYDKKNYTVQKLSNMKAGQTATVDYWDTTKEAQHVWFA